MSAFTASRPLALLTALAILALASPAAADPFDKATGVGVYGSTWSGDYDAMGLGGKARAEFLDVVGVDVFAEVHDVENGPRTRNDVVVGFDLYTPFTVVPGLRIRPLFGFCASFSFVETDHEFAPRSDDIGFGVHAGGGAELGLGPQISLFANVQGVLWFDHGQYDYAPTGMVDGELEANVLTQATAGLQVHLF